MNLKPVDRKPPVEVNLTSLIDVVFLLLIFFMITTTFQQQTRVEVDLPEASESEQRQNADVLEIVINQQGQYFIRGSALVNNQPETLKKALEKVAEGDYKQPLRIRADARTPHQAVVTAMDVAGSLGFSNLRIATTRPGSGKG